ncbi:NAD-dependent epimerase/dehydratase family protein [Chloroflexota bacterium]
MAYLVTGGMGYVGSRIVRDLVNAGEEVVCFDLAGVTALGQEVVGEKNLDRVKVIPGDVSDTIQVFNVIREHSIDYIIHVGYLMGTRREQGPVAALRVNCIGNANMLEAARLFGVKKVVWTSSAAVFGQIMNFYKEPAGDDDVIYMPDSMYAGTKALNEVMTRVYFKNFGVDSIGLRIQRVFGVPSIQYGVVGLFSEFLRKAALNIPVTIKEPDFTINYIHVDDVADAHIKACAVPTTKTRVFNLCEGEHTNQQLVETIRKINPEAQLSLEEGISNLTRPEGDHHGPTMNPTGIRTELGWQPKYSFEEGLRISCNYFRQQAGMPLL